MPQQHQKRRGEQVSPVARKNHSMRTSSLRQKRIWPTCSGCGPYYYYDYRVAAPVVCAVPCARGVERVDGRQQQWQKGGGGIRRVIRSGCLCN
jgi:hypothetical protein